MQAGSQPAAITVAQEALPGHLREHGPECGPVAIQHADATLAP